MAIKRQIAVVFIKSDGPIPKIKGEHARIRVSRDMMARILKDARALGKILKAM